MPEQTAATTRCCETKSEKGQRIWSRPHVGSVNEPFWMTQRGCCEFNYYLSQGDVTWQSFQKVLATQFDLVGILERLDGTVVCLGRLCSRHQARWGSWLSRLRMMSMTTPTSSWIGCHMKRRGSLHHCKGSGGLQVRSQTTVNGQGVGSRKGARAVF